MAFQRVTGQLLLMLRCNSAANEDKHLATTLAQITGSLEQWCITEKGCNLLLPCILISHLMCHPCTRLMVIDVVMSRDLKRECVLSVIVVDHLDDGGVVDGDVLGMTLFVKRCKVYSLIPFGEC
jgi:hypothetical protein